MKIIVISSSDFVKDEAAVTNALFDAGLELFHLRKPEYSEEQCALFVEEINAHHRPKIVSHQHHHLAEQFGMNRIHFPEKERQTVKEEELISLKARGFILSTSVHELSAIDLLSETFSYAFLGPVFESISKPDYKPKAAVTLKKEERKTKIIAIGGITPANMSKVEINNFDGAALLGAIWREPKNAITVFKACSQHATT